MKSLSGKFASTRGWALLLILFLGAGLFVAACGDEETPTPTTPTPTPPAPPPPDPEPPAPEKPATPTGLQVSARTADSITWTWTAVDGATGYLVQASRDETFDDTDQVALTAETSFTATSLPPETSVYVRVAAGVLTAAAPSLDPDDYLLSDWTTHVTGMTDAAAAQAPAAPTNVRGTGQGSNYIEWSWDAVSGAAGYHAQFSRSTDFSDPDADRPLLQRTSVRISNLPAETDGYLRVRAYTGSGTGEDTLFGDWSATSMSSTGEPPPPPAPTALDAPTGLSAGSVTTTSVTLTWSSVIDADSYEVQQQPADGSWTGAACNGGDSRVDVEECEVSGLTRGNDYSFRVRAHPDPDDETLEVSGWSSEASAQTAGSPPRDPVMGGDEELNITWESKAVSITWFWDAASDNRFGYTTAVVADATPRPGCPALTEPDIWSDVTYANRREIETENGETGGVALAPGKVIGLCVRKTWMDDEDNQQYGPVSLVWASTSPAAEPTVSTPLVPNGPKDSKSDTTAIDWYVILDSGFDYEVGTVSASVDDEPSALSCSSVSVIKELTGTGNTRYRLSNLADYTQYLACARATNGSGTSGWTKLNTYWTLPARGPTPSYSTQGTLPEPVGPSDTTTAWTTATIPSVAWSFSGGQSLPEAPGGYEMKIIGWENTGRSASPKAPTCDVTDADTDYVVVTAATINATGSGFENAGDEMAGLAAVGGKAATATASGSHGSVYLWACVRAELRETSETTEPRTVGRPTGSSYYGPWSSVGRKVLSLGTQQPTGS